MITAQDIAKLSGVSRTTVFAVLKGKPGVSERARNKVIAAIREHGYENGLVQRSLISEVSRMVGVVVGDIKNPFYTEAIYGIHSVLAPRGFHHFLHHGPSAQSEEGGEKFHDLDAYELRGYIISAGDVDHAESQIRRVLDSKRPLVTIMEVPGLETHRVRFDNRKCSRDATDYLVERGHHRIACLTGPLRSVTAKERLMGFVESLIAHEIEFQESMTVRAGDTADDGYRAALQVLSVESGIRPTALVCCNDLVAIGCYKAANQLGLGIPQDVSVVGFDGIELGEAMGPPLTTLSVFPREMGRMAAEVLLTILGDTKTRQGHIERIVEHQLIERASVKAL